MPHLRFKQDLIPGTEIFQWVQATKTTKEMRVELDDDKFEFEIACAELCGYNHYQMRGKVFIVENDEFEAKLKELAEFDCPEIWDDDGFNKSMSYTKAGLKTRKDKADNPHGDDDHDDGN